MWSPTRYTKRPQRSARDLALTRMTASSILSDEEEELEDDFNEAAPPVAAAAQSSEEEEKDDDDDEEESPSEHHDHDHEEDQHDSDNEEDDSHHGVASDEGEESSEDDDEDDEEDGSAEEEADEDDDEEAAYLPTSKWKEPGYTFDQSAADNLRQQHGLTLYELHRKPRRVPSGRWHCSVTVPEVLEAFRCIICFSTLKRPKVVRECLHRFCEDCIEKSLRMGRNECPVCRVFVPSKRNLAPDVGFETLLRSVLGPTPADLSDYEDNNDNNNNNNEAEKKPPFRPIAAANRAVATADDDDDDDARHDDDNNNDDDDSNPDDSAVTADAAAAAAAEEEEDHLLEMEPTALVDLCLHPHPDETHLPQRLAYPYLRLAGDATVGTLVAFLQAKFSTTVPLALSLRAKTRPLAAATPLYLVGDRTLYYRVHVKGRRSASSSLSSTLSRSKKRRKKLTKKERGVKNVVPTVYNNDN